MCFKCKCVKFEVTMMCDLDLLPLSKRTKRLMLIILKKLLGRNVLSGGDIYFQECHDACTCTIACRTCGAICHQLTLSSGIDQRVYLASEKPWQRTVWRRHLICRCFSSLHWRSTAAAWPSSQSQCPVILRKLEY